MLKKIIAAFSLLVVFVAVSCQLSAVEAFDRPTFISIVNPVRGPEGWSVSKQTPLDFPRLQYQLATTSAMPITWLLRFDAINDATISAFFSDLSATDSSQTLGAFLEITPLLTEAAKVTYPPGEYPSAANRIFLSGYSPEERLKLIDAYMSLFKKKFGSYPSAVGAWHIDSYSLSYLRNKYSILVAVICDEQYNTDNYRIWGGYIGSPYLPTKTNFLVPASSKDNKIDIAITKWAARDFFNFYGEGSQSTFSFQVNDYISRGLKTNYFEGLLNQYTQKDFNEFSQIVIGIENDYEIKWIADEVERIYPLLARSKNKYNLQFVSLANFGSWFLNRYSQTSPAYFYQTQDITEKKPGKVFWYQNPFYRIGLKSEAGKTKIIDFRVYNDKEAEEYYQVKNISRRLHTEINPVIDSVKYPGSEIEIPINLESADISHNGWRVTFTKDDQIFRLEPKQLVFTNLVPPPIDTQEIKVKQKGTSFIWQIAPKLPFTSSAGQSIIIAVLLLILLLVILIKLKKNHPPLVGVFIFGLAAGLIAVITMFHSGLVYPFGLGFWGPNGHDALFHLSLGENFRRSLFNLSHPQLAGFQLSNYHFAFDWLMALISKITKLSQLDLYFRYLPLVSVALLSLSAIHLLRLWRYKNSAITLSIVLMFLTGSLGFVRGLLTGEPFFGGESIFWSNQSVSIFLNPPFALSLLVLIVFTYLFEKNVRKLTPLNFIILILLGGALAQIKIYAFILLCLSLLILRQIKLLIGVSVVGLILLLPAISLNGTPFIFSPLWFVRSLFEARDRFYWQKLAEAWQVYETTGVLGKLMLVNFLGIIIFYLGNLGIRVIGLINCLVEKNQSASTKLIKYIILFGLLIPLLFIQKVNPWNTIQFLYYALFFLAFFTAKQITDWLTNSKYKVLNTIFYILMALLVLPTTIGTLRDYITPLSASRVGLTELRALDKLRRSPRGTVISPLYNESLTKLLPDPKPLYGYVSTAYISALSGQPEYLSDTINLDITGFDYKMEVKNVQRLYLTRDPNWVKEFLKTNSITYVYENPMGKLQIHPEQACLTRIFDSGEVNIYKYHCDE